jgi:hypothetical protein
MFVPSRNGMEEKLSYGVPSQKLGRSYITSALLNAITIHHRPSENSIEDPPALIGASIITDFSSKAYQIPS